MRSRTIGRARINSAINAVINLLLFFCFKFVFARSCRQLRTLGRNDGRVVLTTRPHRLAGGRRLRSGSGRARAGPRPACRGGRAARRRDSAYRLPRHGRRLASPVPRLPLPVPYPSQLPVALGHPCRSIPTHSQPLLSACATGRPDCALCPLLRAHSDCALRSPRPPARPAAWGGRCLPLHPRRFRSTHSSLDRVCHPC